VEIMSAVSTAAAAIDGMTDCAAAETPLSSPAPMLRSSVSRVVDFCIRQAWWVIVAAASSLYTVRHFDPGKVTRQKAKTSNQC
jgi:hypothetical protein